MIYKLWSLSFFILAICVIFSGCAAIGGNATISDAKAIQKISRVYLPPFIVVDEWPKTDTIVVPARIYSFLCEKLNDVFTVVLFDSVKYKSVAMNIEKARQMGQESGADAIVFAQLRYYLPLFDAPSAELKLNLIDPSTGKVIAFSSHDTHLGNSYFSIEPPSRAQITGDAIVGCVETLKKAVTQIRSLKSAR